MEHKLQGKNVILLEGAAVLGVPKKLIGTTVVLEPVPSYLRWVEDIVGRPMYKATFGKEAYLVIAEREDDKKNVIPCLRETELINPYKGV